MAKTESNMIPLGTIAPDFTLLNTVLGIKQSLTELKSDTATVIMFLCNHCPFVKHIQSKLVAVAKAYQKKGVAFIAISSNDIKNYPQDGPLLMKEEALAHHYSFPYLYDETQAVAKAYQAACTPDFYIFDRALVCVYRGRFDGATPGNSTPITGDELTHALDQLLSKQAVSTVQHPSVGCNIKWKAR